MFIFLIISVFRFRINAKIVIIISIKEKTQMSKSVTKNKKNQMANCCYENTIVKMEIFILFQTVKPINTMHMLRAQRSKFKLYIDLL